LELQVKALIHGRSHRAKLIEMISKKELVSDVFNQLQLALQRRNHAHPAQVYPQKLSRPVYPLP